jgi:hypothetical protein
MPRQSISPRENLVKNEVYNAGNFTEGLLCEELHLANVPVFASKTIEPSWRGHRSL